MSDLSYKKFTELPATTTLATADVIPVVTVTGVNASKKITFDSLNQNITAASINILSNTINSAVTSTQLAQSWTTTRTTVNANSATWGAGGGGSGLSIFTEVSSTVAPNNTTYAFALSVKSSVANTDIVLTPKGSGGILANISDNTIAGGNKRGIYAVDLQRLRSGAADVASGAYSTLLGGSYNKASGGSSVVVGGDFNTASGDQSTVGGGSTNTASGIQSTIGGGGTNIASNSNSTVGGGVNNTASGFNSTVAGGANNNSLSSYSVVGGGQLNTAQGAYSIIGGGSNNTASGSQYSTIGGGYNNTASKNYSTVGGGYSHVASGSYSMVGGGYLNYATGTFSCIPGGQSNSALGNYATAIGGLGNYAEGDYATAIGGSISRATGNYAVSIGSFASAGRVGQIAFGGDNGGTGGGLVQKSIYNVFRRVSTSAVSANMFIDGNDNSKVIELPNNVTYGYTANFVASITGNSTGNMFNTTRGVIKSYNNAIQLFSTQTVGTALRTTGTGSNLNAGLSAVNNTIKIVAFNNTGFTYDFGANVEFYELKDSSIW